MILLTETKHRADLFPPEPELQSLIQTGEQGVPFASHPPIFVVKKDRTSPWNLLYYAPEELHSKQKFRFREVYTVTGHDHHGVDILRYRNQVFHSSG